MILKTFLLMMKYMKSSILAANMTVNHAREKKRSI